MRQGPKWVAALVAQAVALLAAYVLERHVLGPLLGQPMPGDLTGAVWLQAVGWVVVAAFGLIVAWTVLGRARGDLAPSVLVTAVGLCVWIAVPLAYTAGVGDLIPNWVLHVAYGEIGYVPAAAAWSLTVGVLGIVLALSHGRGRG